MKRTAIIFLFLSLLSQSGFALRKPDPKGIKEDRDNMRFLETYVKSGNEINKQYQEMNRRGRELQFKVDSKTATKGEVAEFEKLKKTVPRYKAARDQFYKDAAEVAIELYDLKPAKLTGKNIMRGPFKGIEIIYRIKIGVPQKRKIKSGDGKTIAVPPPPGRTEAIAYQDGLIMLHPNAFKNPAFLASTIYHEGNHVEQYLTPGSENLTWHQREAKAYKAEIDNAEIFGLSENEIRDLKTRRIGHQMGLDPLPRKKPPFGHKAPPVTKSQGKLEMELLDIKMRAWRLEAQIKEERREHLKLEKCKKDFAKAVSQYNRYAKKVETPLPVNTEGMTCRQEVNEIWRLAQKMMKDIDAAFYRCQEKVDVYKAKYGRYEQFLGPCKDVLAKWQAYEREIRELGRRGTALRIKLWLQDADNAAKQCGFRRTGKDGWRFRDMETGKSVVIRHSGNGTKKDMDSLLAGFLITRTCLDPGKWWACNKGAKIIDKRWGEQKFQDYLPPSSENDAKASACMAHVARGTKPASYGELKSTVRIYYRALEEKNRPRPSSRPNRTPSHSPPSVEREGVPVRSERDTIEDLPWCMQAPGRNCIGGL